MYLLLGLFMFKERVSWVGSAGKLVPADLRGHSRSLVILVRWVVSSSSRHHCRAEKGQALAGHHKLLHYTLPLFGN